MSGRRKDYKDMTPDDARALVRKVPVTAAWALAYVAEEVRKDRIAAKVFRDLAAEPATLPSSRDGYLIKAEIKDERADALDLVLGFAKVAHEVAGGGKP